MEDTTECNSMQTSGSNQSQPGNEFHETHPKPSKFQILNDQDQSTQTMMESNLFKNNQKTEEIFSLNSYSKCDQLNIRNNQTDRTMRGSKGCQDDQETQEIIQLDIDIARYDQAQGHMLKFTIFFLAYSLISMIGRISQTGNVLQGFPSLFSIIHWVIVYLSIKEAKAALQTVQFNLLSKTIQYLNFSYVPQLLAIIFLIVLEIVYEKEESDKQKRRFLDETDHDKKSDYEKKMEEEDRAYNLAYLRFLGLLFLLFEIFLVWYKYSQHIKVARGLQSKMEAINLIKQYNKNGANNNNVNQDQASIQQQYQQFASTNLQDLKQSKNNLDDTVK